MKSCRKELAGANPSHAAKEDQRVVDRQAPQCDEEARRRRRMDTEKIGGHWLVRRKKCRGCDNEEGTEKHRVYHCPSWREGRNQIPEGFGEVEAKGEDEERRSNCRKSHLSVHKWESEKHKGWTLPVEGSREPCHHRWRLVGTPSRKCAFGWSVVQLDHDKEMWLVHGMYGTLDGELEVQRTFKKRLMWTANVPLMGSGVET